MHQSAMKYGKEFFETYCSNGFHGKTIVDVGAQDVNGSLREFCPVGAKYIGVDFVEGKGVDIVLTDPYQLPFDAESVDVVVCSSVFEHSEFFWLLFLECIRILKPDGLFYLNVPSNGYVHRYPVDSWRFYPDAGHSLVNWSRRNSFDTLLLESFVAEKQGLITGDGMWNDFVAVVLKDEAYESNYPDRIFNKNRNYVCGYTSNGVNEFPLFVQNSDHKLILEQQSILVTLNQSIADRDSQIAERDTRIEGLAQALAERDTRIEGLTQALAEIHKSLIWRLTKPLRKGKDFAFTKF